MAYARAVAVEWDPEKDETNRAKHGLSFSEASVLFDSEGDYLVIFDEAHSESEDRFIAIGGMERGVAVIVFTEPDEDTIRIISARWATVRERSLYRSYKERGS